MTNEPEVLAVRQLAPEPTDESVTRAWYRITQLEATRTRGLRHRRWVPAVAAATVMVVAAGSLIFVRLGGGVLWPADSTPEAVAALSSLAERAESEPPVTIGDGQLVLSHSTGWAGEFSPTEGTLLPRSRQAWFDPRLGQPLKIMEGDQDLMSGPKAQSDPAASREPGIRYPTLSWLAGLPTNPALLLKELRIQVGQNDSWTVDHQVWDAVGQLFNDCEIVLTPQQRATFLRAFTGLTGLTVQDTYVQGQRLIAIRHTEKESGQDIYFDPLTGHAVGRASIFTHKDLTIIYPTGGPAFEPGTASQMVWSQSIVDGL